MRRAWFVFLAAVLAGCSMPPLETFAPQPSALPQVVEPFDATAWEQFEDFASGLQAASDEWRHGRKAEAFGQMERTFSNYASILAARYPESNLSPLEQDVLGIRNAIRDPKGLVLRGVPSYPFKAAFLNPSVRVSLADGVSGEVIVRRPLQNRPWTIFITDRQLERVEGILGGDHPFERSTTRPVRLWQQFVGVFPGHVQAWSARAHPALIAVKFDDFYRTRATARIATSDASGEEVLLEKHDGKWRAVKIGSFWIA